MNPKNCQTVNLKLISKKTAKVLGKLAQKVMDQTFKCRQKLVYNNNIPKAIESKDANEDYQM